MVFVHRLGDQESFESVKMMKRHDRERVGVLWLDMKDFETVSIDRLSDEISQVIFVRYFPRRIF